MAAKTSFLPHEITATFLPPETLQAERMAALIEQGASAEEVAQAAQQTSRGEYREWLGEEVINNMTHAKLGRLLVWVDDAPDDGKDGTGHYEVAEEGPDYVPVITGDAARERLDG